MKERRHTENDRAEVMAPESWNDRSMHVLLGHSRSAIIAMAATLFLTHTSVLCRSID